MPACTVVIPLFNRAGEIGRALASVLAQTRSDFEVIVVDDGSTDGGAEKARACRDPRVRVIAQPNRGPGAARNRGVAEARSLWVAFLDSDDEWRPRFLERVLGLAEGHPEVNAVFSNIQSVRDGGPWLDMPDAEPALLDDYLGFVIRQRGRGMTCSSSVVNRARLLAAGGFASGVARSEDLDAWLRLAMSGAIGCVPSVLADFHNESMGRTRSFPEPCFPQSVRTLRRLLAEGRIPPALARRLPRLEALYLLVHARDWIEYGRPERARRVLLRECSWRHCPPGMLAKTLVKSLAGGGAR